MTVKSKLIALGDRWTNAQSGELANYQLYLIELCEALGVERPRPKGTGYEFELSVHVINRDGTESTERADLYKQGCFLLEAKDEDKEESSDRLMRRAYGQARSYVTHLPGQPPPYILVLDVAKTLMVWDRWSGEYGGFNAGSRIDLRTLAMSKTNIALARDVWQDPSARDPRSAAQVVTKEIAEKLAELAASLEDRGHEQENVARFLMRCVFTMFAEDVGLLDEEPFMRAVRNIGLKDPEEFQTSLRKLWQAMDEGKHFGIRKLLRFNGHFFQDHSVLPLTRDDLAVLLKAAQANWEQVEPSIFGTLLTRALDPVERHKLGAEFTPRTHVERVVRPAVEEPIRERWTLVEAEVLQLRERGKNKQALAKLRKFHDWLRSLTFLDPACGSGNFLYVTLDLVKRLEAEVIQAEEEITGHPDLKLQEVGPWQFYGIEVKQWAREIAELTLWIGYHQFWQQHHEDVRPPEPVLRDTGTLERRDAVLVWDEILDDPNRVMQDPTPRLRHPVTGQLVPDPNATIPYLAHKGARPAEWPKADFIIGNPPYMGNKRMREFFGDGYVDALRAAYTDVPESADYVMYWWYKAANEVAEGRAIRAGLITTNSITQSFNRGVVANAMKRGVRVVWAIPTHPWVDEAGSAAVRVAMTVIARDPKRAIRLEVDDDSRIVRRVEAIRLNSDLSAHADVAGATEQPLLGNRGMSIRGFTLVGRGFVLTADEAEDLLDSDPRHSEVIRPYRNGRDLTRHPRGVYVVDFGTLTEARAREYPVLYDIVRDRVKPQRDANRRKSRRLNWWRFGEPVPALRSALEGLSRFIATPYVSKHRFFVFLDTRIAPDEKIVCIASEDPFVLGVLSSRIHTTWALAAGSKLETRPTYNNSLCFEAFPFPVADDPSIRAVRAAATALNQHREVAVSSDDSVTMTGLYNIVEKLQAGEDLSQKESKLHQRAACGVLRDLHDELDMSVARCYGWPWRLPVDEILLRLVELHDTTVERERGGHVQWLRTDYQVPSFEADVGEPAAFDLVPGLVEEEPGKTVEWPSSTVEQIAAIQGALIDAPGTVEEISRRFKGARRQLVDRHLETLSIMGEARQDEKRRYHPV